MQFSIIFQDFVSKEPKKLAEENNINFRLNYMRRPIFFVLYSDTVIMRNVVLMFLTRT